MIEKLRFSRINLRSESPSSAPMPDEPQSDLPPPMFSSFEELANTSHGPAAAMNQGCSYHVQGNAQWGGIQDSVQGREEYGASGGVRYGRDEHGKSWNGGGGDSGGRDGYGGDRDGQGWI